MRLHDHELAWADGTRAEAQVGDTRRVLDEIEAADGYVLGTPIYRATYSGPLKNRLDLVPRGGYDGDAAPLRAEPVGVVATGATAHHFLGADQLLPILRGFFASDVVPPVAYAHGGQYDADGRVADEALRESPRLLGTALVALARALRASPELRSVTSQL